LFFFFLKGLGSLLQNASHHQKITLQPGDTIEGTAGFEPGV
jgi:hypothetical protein